MKRYLVLVLIGILFWLPTSTIAQDNSYIVLRTFWNVPGVLPYSDCITPYGNFIIISDENNLVTRLVEFETGEILYENDGKESLKFSPNGQFTVASVQVSSTFVSGLIETNSGQLISEINGSQLKFSADSAFAMAVRYEPDTTEYLTQIIDTSTGETIAEFQGSGDEFSPDNSQITIVTYGTTTIPPKTQMINIATGQIQLEIVGLLPPIGSEGAYAGLDTVFTADGEMLVIYMGGYINTSRFYDVGSGTLLSEVPGAVLISPNSQFVIANNAEGFTVVQLIDTATWQVLDEVSGSMLFSTSGEFYFRVEIDQPIGDNNVNIQLVRLDSQAIEAEYSGFINVNLVGNDKFTKLYDNQTRTTQLIDLENRTVIGKWLGYGTFLESQNLILFEENGNNQLIDYLSGDVLLSTSDQIRVPEFGNYVFVNDGQFVSVLARQES